MLNMDFLFVLFFLHSELLDEAEFGEAASYVEYDETTMNSALELGLLVCSLINEISKHTQFLTQLTISLVFVSFNTNC